MAGGQWLVGDDQEKEAERGWLRISEWGIDNQKVEKDKDENIEERVNKSEQNR